MTQREPECPCTKADCERHGDCVACHINHADKEKPIFCRRPESAAGKELEERVIARLQAAGIPFGRNRQGNS